MKNILLFIAILLFVLISCEDTVPTLPEDYDWSGNVDFDIGEGEDVEYEKSALIVATSEGYSVPFSGHLYISYDENIADLKEEKVDFKLGGSVTTDLNLAVAGDRFMIIGRDGADSIGWLIKGDDESSNREGSIAKVFDSYVNLHDAIYNELDSSYLVTANQHNAIFHVKDGGNKIDEISLEKIAEPFKASPAASRIRVIGKNAYVTLQLLDENWKSMGGVVAVIDLEDYSITTIETELSNLFGKIEYNPAADSEHIYIAASGTLSGGVRDGGIVRININSRKSEILIGESSEPGNILNSKFIDLSISNSGTLFLMVSDDTDKYRSKILKIERSGKVTELDSEVNSVAGSPMDYSPLTDTLYYFRNEKDKTFLCSADAESGEIMNEELEFAPNAVKVWLINKMGVGVQESDEDILSGSDEDSTTELPEDAVVSDSKLIKEWASGYLEPVTFGEDVDENWKDPEKALGKAEGNSEDVVSLGRGGEIVLTFENAAINGERFDFAIFENAFNEGALELAFVEVSSDGEKFVRFDSRYLGTEPISEYGTNMKALDISGLAGKYKRGIGTAFDLGDLSDKEAVKRGDVDLDNIKFIKIIDITGDGSIKDSSGNKIYDPWPTKGSAGFDLDGACILNIEKK